MPGSVLSPLLAAALLSCATVPKPVDQFAKAEASLRTAQEMGARDVPSAALQLQLAQEELSAAQTAMDKGDNRKAAGLLERSQADAELAIGLVKADRAEKEAREAEQRLSAMQGPPPAPAAPIPPAPAH
jgi:hypothetical protein